MLGEKKKLVKRPEEEPKFSFKNPQDKFFFWFVIIAVIVLLAILAGLIALYVINFGS